MKQHRPLAEISSIVAFRHVGPFPEWAAVHPRHKDVLLCMDCMEDWFAASVDPFFDDRVIEMGFIYLDADGMESAGATDRILETVTLDEVLALGSPKRCQGCNRRWETIEGIRIVYR